MKIISGTANVTLAEEISRLAEGGLVKADIRRFNDKEIFVEILENVRGQDVFVVQPTPFPANDNLMELLVIIDTLRRGSASRITAVIPYFGYARQDRKTAPRTPISAKLVANLIAVAGADRILTMDLHAAQIQGFFDIPADNLFAAPLFSHEIKKSPDFNPEGLMVVSPDVGGVTRARNLAKRLGVEIAIVDKRRPRAGESKVMNVIGDVRGKRCILVDDIVDTAGTLCNAAVALVERGATEVSALCSHGVFSGPALERIAQSSLKQVVVTDSIEATEEVKKVQKIRQISIANLLFESMLRIHQNRSVSSLFNENWLHRI